MNSWNKSFVIALSVLALSAMPLTASQAADATKKVFAHYMVAFPMANKPVSLVSGQDSYENVWMRAGPDTVSAKHGGYVRSRPVRPPQDLTQLYSGPLSWTVEIHKLEINNAMAVGIDGFTVDYGPSDTDLTVLKQLLQATNLVNADKHSNFKIILTPDVDTYMHHASQYGDSSLRMASDIASLVADPKLRNALYFDNGKLVVEPYHTEIQSIEWWNQVLANLAAQSIPVAFVPEFRDFSSPESKNYLSRMNDANDQEAQKFLGYSIGVAVWHEHSHSSPERTAANVATFAALGKFFVQPISPQDFRPKVDLYWEAQGSTMFRAGWDSAIRGGAQWAQLITWNDYSEATQLQPSTNPNRESETGFYSLLPYYVNWFKANAAPPIFCDRLYYFHRRMPTNVSRINQDKVNPAVDSVAPENKIEALGFLSAPASIRISFNGKDYYSGLLPAGIQSFKIDIPGSGGASLGYPAFAIIRNGKEVLTLTSNSQFVTVPADGHVDFTYKSGSSSSDSCSTSSAAPPPRNHGWGSK